MTSLKLQNDLKSKKIDAFNFTDREHLFAEVKSGNFRIGEFSKSNVNFFILEKFEKLPKRLREHSFFSSLWLAKQFKNHPYFIDRVDNFTSIYSEKNGKELMLSQITPGQFCEYTQWQVGGSLGKISGHIINDYRLLSLIIRLFRLEP